MTGLVKKRLVYYILLGLILIGILGGYALIIINQNTDNIKRFNRQLEGTARISAVYLASNYNLYGSPPTIKFRSIAKNFLVENEEITKFELFDTDGSIVFASESPDRQDYGQVEAILLTYSRRDELTSIKDKNKIKILIAPYFEEWGSHKYSVLFYPSYEQVDSTNWQFSVELGIITLLSIIILAGIALTLTLRERSKMHEEEKFKLEKIDEQRQEFITLVAHNLRTPVTIIQGYLSLLTEMKISDEQKKMIEPVTETVHNLYLLIEQMLTITNLLGRENFTIEKQELKIQELVEGVLSEHQNKIDKQSLEVMQYYNPKGLSIYTNDRYIKMVLTLLIENAVKFNKPEGKIYIKAYNEHDNTVVSIADTGIGISKEEQGNVFVKFHKLDSHKSVYDYNYAGTGLGLYTAKVVIEALGGKIWFESTEAVGTTFYISLPKPSLS